MSKKNNEIQDDILLSEFSGFAIKRISFLLKNKTEKDMSIFAKIKEILKDKDKDKDSDDIDIAMSFIEQLARHYALKGYQLGFLEAGKCRDHITRT